MRRGGGGIDRKHGPSRGHDNGPPQMVKRFKMQDNRQDPERDDGKETDGNQNDGLDKDNVEAQFMKNENDNTANEGLSGLLNDLSDSAGIQKRHDEFNRNGGGMRGGRMYNLRNQSHQHSFDRRMNQNRPAHNPNNNSFLPPFFSNSFHPQQRILDRIRNLNQNELVPRKYEVKKFMANTRLYVGNIANDVADDDLKELFQPYGDMDELFVNREKNFAFLKLDFRTNAEKARADLDQRQLKGRPIKVRFAPANVRLKVKNLAPNISNELLEMGFSVFGDIERALVYVDDKGRSVGEGIIDFTRKNNALLAHRFCTEHCYFLSTELRPVETELGEMYEVDEGLLELNLNTSKGGFGKDKGRPDQSFFQSREMGPRVADEGSFEYEYGMKWKALTNEYKLKEQEMKQELKLELENLRKKMEIAKYDYETEMLRRQLKQREMDQERHRMEWEQRASQNSNRGFMGGGGRNSFGGGGPNRGPGPQGGGGGLLQQPRLNTRFSSAEPPVPDSDVVPDIVNVPIEEPENPSVSNGGNNFSDDVNIFERASATDGALAPPPLPPQGLMDMDNLELAPADLNQNVTWEIGPFASFGNQQQQQQPQFDGQGGPGQGQVFRDRPRFGGGGGGGGGGSMRGGGGNRGNFNRGGNRGGGFNRGGGRVLRR